MLFDLCYLSCLHTLVTSSLRPLMHLRSEVRSKVIGGSLRISDASQMRHALSCHHRRRRHHHHHHRHSHRHRHHHHHRHQCWSTLSNKMVTSTLDPRCLTTCLEDARVSQACPRPSETNSCQLRSVTGVCIYLYIYLSLCLSLHIYIYIYVL